MKSLFLAVLKMSLVSSYIILFVMVVRFLLKRVKAPKIFSYALWTVVFIKLICPVTLESVISLVPREISTQNLENTYFPDTLTAPGNKQVVPPVSEYTTQTDTVKMEVKDEENKPSLVHYLSIIWLCGILVSVAYSIVSIKVLKKKLSEAVPLEDNLYETSVVQTPFVMGIIKPRIYLPSALKEEEKVYILRHEQVHIKRRDYLIKIITFIITCIHWFNPLVWLAFVLMNRDMEMSCDERVIRDLGNNIKKDYSASLLSMAAGRQIPKGTPLAFGENNVKSRIKNVLNYKKPTLWIIMISAAAVALVCIGLFLSPKSSAKETYEEQTMPVYMENFVIASNEVTLYDNSTATLKLILTEGMYYDEDYAGAGGGTYKDNYDGNYELQLWGEDGSILSTFNLNEDWDYPKINFSGKFDILFTDYNEDNCPDFSIGTYGSSSMNLYYLYTITENNQINRICQDSIAEFSKELSVVFEHEREDGEKAFLTYGYNNATGANNHTIYEWDEESGYFRIREDGENNSENSSEDNSKEETGESSSGTVTFSADLTHDGVQETILMDPSKLEAEQKAVLSAENEKGAVIWSEDAYTPHTGWDSIYLYMSDNQAYLLRYHPEMFQGLANYSYELFYLKEDGTEVSVDSDRINFSINAGDENIYDPEGLAAFAEKVNGYLNNSFLLLSTEEGLLEYSTPSNKITRTESYSWLETSAVTYNSEVLLDKLTQYKNDYISRFLLGEGYDTLLSMFGESHNYYFQKEYTGEDYDGDGLADTAALHLTEDGSSKYVEITFGNGEILKVTGIDSVARDFKIAGADLDKNGDNEIVIIYDIGANGGDFMYNLAVYKKQNSSYKALDLPEGYNMESGFTYNMDWDGKTAAVTSEKLGNIGTIDNTFLENHYFRIGITEDWEKLQGKSAHTIADGVCDFIINKDSEKPLLILKQYLTGPTEVHVDCIGYIITELSLSKDGSWNIEKAYYLPSD